ncbi:CidA/LrgA family protein [Paenibacillus ginsengarvi]|uniref:CidA/LrgA family protein n=1 Tax=Paenibacillus ginsengarvi TaxID=400777 RepID=A0A3B0CHN6_9BACL|nr:CidA/LrgA family protein [Paenibacillus ginsengarvi]RKN84134.1 CidA/LrgA family protein [Paenibacillus ginsengarvi]
MRGLAILLSFHFAGLLLRYYAHIPLPAGVIGLVLFVISLFAGWVKLEWVEDSAQFLLKHMMLFFAPFIVGTITFARIIGSNAAGIGLSLIAGTLLVLAVSGKVTAHLSRKEGERIDGKRMVE